MLYVVVHLFVWASAYGLHQARAADGPHLAEASSPHSKLSIYSIALALVWQIIV